MRRFHRTLLASLVFLALAVSVAWAVVKINARSTGGIEWDAPRTPFQLVAINFTAATTEAMVTLTPVRDFVNGTTGTTFTVTATKRMRLLGICVTTKNAGAAAQGVIVRIRVDPASTVTTADPAILSIGAGTNLAIANVVGSRCVMIDDRANAIELSGAAQIGISQIGTATAGNDVTLWGYEY